MTPEVRENWRRIKKALEEADKTDCDFYRRAVLVVNGAEDPGPLNWGHG